jgi:hypothetical protein
LYFAVDEILVIKKIFLLEKVRPSSIRLIDAETQLVFATFLFSSSS